VAFDDCGLLESESRSRNVGTDERYIEFGNIGGGIRRPGLRPGNGCTRGVGGAGGVGVAGGEGLSRVITLGLMYPELDTELRPILELLPPPLPMELLTLVSVNTNFK
jgi:hypothetical protein